jgi:hypothetical protein
MHKVIRSVLLRTVLWLRFIPIIVASKVRVLNTALLHIVTEGCNANTIRDRRLKTGPTGSRHADSFDGYNF